MAKTLKRIARRARLRVKTAFNVFKVNMGDQTATNEGITWLGRLRHPKVVPVLTTVLQKPISSDGWSPGVMKSTQLAALTTLGTIHHPDVIIPLVHALGSSNRDVATLALDQLANIEQALPKRFDNHPYVRILQNAQTIWAQSKPNKSPHDSSVRENAWEAPNVAHAVCIQALAYPRAFRDGLSSLQEAWSQLGRNAQDKVNEHPAVVSALVRAAMNSSTRAKLHNRPYCRLLLSQARALTTRGHAKH